MMKLSTIQNTINLPNAKLIHRHSISASLRFAIVLAQCFALLPVVNHLSRNVRSFRFSWFSFRIVYSAFAITGMLFMASMGIVHGVSNGFTLRGVVSTVFFGGESVTVLLFMWLAGRWSKLIDAWRKVDRRMERSYGYPVGLSRELKVLTVVIMTLATLEHQSSLVFQILVISYRNNGSIPVDYYYKYRYPQVFNYINYNNYLAAVIQVLTVLTTFTWTYGDLFIIILSTALVSRFKQVTKRLQKAENTKNTIFWIEIRKDYDQLCQLSGTLSDHLSYIVLLSYVLNLFFILVQLYHSLSIADESLEKIYYIYSFLFLILRTVTVSLFAARINDESKKPIAILNSVSSSVYNIEIERLLMQISTDGVALTGCNLFKITRGLILNIAGAIVTYELVLIQFCTASNLAL